MCILYMTIFFKDKLKNHTIAARIYEKISSEKDPQKTPCLVTSCYPFVILFLFYHFNQLHFYVTTGRENVCVC